MLECRIIRCDKTDSIRIRFKKDKLTVYTLFDENGKEQGIYLSESDKGYIRFVKDKNMPITFIAPKYYYFPIPFKQVQLNPNLKQPTGW